MLNFIVDRVRCMSDRLVHCFGERLGDGDGCMVVARDRLLVGVPVEFGGVQLYFGRGHGEGLSGARGVRGGLRGDRGRGGYGYGLNKNYIILIYFKTHQNKLIS